MEVKVLAAGLPSTLPADSFGYLIGVLTGGEKLNRLQGVKAAYDIVGYLLSKFFAEATAEAAVAEKKMSKKQVAAALQSLKDGQVQAKGLPTWLLPILLDLAQRWLTNRK